MTGDVIEGFQVQAKGTPAMSVTIVQGTAGVTTGTYPDSFRYWIANDTTTGTPAGESVTISPASASNPRITTVGAFVNESQTFATSPVNQPGGWTAFAVDGSPNASPSGPNSSAIQSAVGAGNPYIILADVLVGTNVTQINSGNITDRRNMMYPIATGPGIFGANGAMVSWTPTMTNLSIGNGSIDARAVQVGKVVKFRMLITLGSTSSVGTNPTFTLPVTSVATPNSLFPLGTCFIDNNGGSGFNGFFTWQSTTVAGFRSWDVNNNSVSLTATAPVTWASGYKLYGEGEYEAA